MAAVVEAVAVGVVVADAVVAAAVVDADSSHTRKKNNMFRISFPNILISFLNFLTIDQSYRF